MRRCLVALALVLGGLAAGSARAAGPVVLGEINPRTGLLAVQGTAIHQGILLAVEEGNARGGLAGRRIELHSRDDEGAPQRAIAAAEELARVDVETPLGRVQFDATGEPLFYERVIVQIQNGRHVVVYPRERATAAVRYPAR
jgi:hypothetical protein